MKYPRHLSRLIDQLKTLPGVGGKTAERFAFYLIDLPETKLKELGSTIAMTKEHIVSCSDCGCLLVDEKCTFCDPNCRNSEMMCVISSPKDVFAIEMTNQYRGFYHVLGGVLSPLDGRGPEALRIKELVNRLNTYQINELVIALDSTLEGDATALYLSDQLRESPIKVTRLASGLPMGSTLEFVDGGTLAYALSARAELVK